MTKCNNCGFVMPNYLKYCSYCKSKLRDKMTSYKEMYLRVKKDLKQLESNSVDIRDMYSGKILSFDKKKWRLLDDNVFKIVIQRI